MNKCTDAHENITPAPATGAAQSQDQAKSVKVPSGWPEHVQCSRPSCRQRQPLSAYSIYARAQDVADALNPVLKCPLCGNVFSPLAEYFARERQQESTVAPK